MSPRRLSPVVTDRCLQLVPSSPPRLTSTSFNTEDGNIPWGFGFEFEPCLQAKWQDDLERQEARLKRYHQFGMDADDARQPTPEYMREQYDRFIQKELNDVHTPSPPPSPESLPRGPTRSVNRFCRPGDASNGLHRRSILRKRGGGPGVRTDNNGPTIAPAGIKKRRKKSSTRSLRNLPSTHPMETRSKTRLRTFA